jgi:hypothetical protein
MAEKPSLKKKLTRISVYINQQAQELVKPQLQNIEDGKLMGHFTTLTEENRTNMKEVVSGLKKNIKLQEGLIEHGRVLSTTFQTYSQSLLKYVEPFHPFAKCLEDAGKFQNQMEKIREATLRSLKENIVEVMDTFIQNDIAEAQNAKKRFEKVQLNYDSAISKTKAAKTKKNPNITKIQEAEQEEKNAKAAFEGAEKDCLDALRQNARNTDLIFTLKLLQYFDAHMQFFKDGIAYLESISPNIEKYRKSINTLMSNKIQPTTAASRQFDSKVFKCTLVELSQREGRKIPRIVAKSCQFLEDTATDVQGLLRVSAVKDDVEALKNEIDRYGDADYSRAESPHVIGGVLKLFLRQLPDPLLTTAKYSAFIKAGKLQDNEERISEFKKLLSELPECHYLTFQRMIKLCVKLDEKREVNKMTAYNISTVLGPNLLYGTDMNPITMVQEMEVANGVITMIIENYDKIFATPLPEETVAELSIDVEAIKAREASERVAPVSARGTRSAPTTPDANLSRSADADGIKASKNPRKELKRNMTISEAPSKSRPAAADLFAEERNRTNSIGATPLTLNGIKEATESPPSSPTSSSPLSARSQMKRQASLRVVKTRTLKDSSPRSPLSPTGTMPEDEEVGLESGSTTPHSESGTETTTRPTDTPLSPIKSTQSESSISPAGANAPPVPPRGAKPTPPPRNNLFANNGQTASPPSSVNSVASDEKSDESSVSSQEQPSSLTRLTVPSMATISTSSQRRTSVNLDDIEAQVVALNSRKSLDLSIVLAWLKNVTTESVAPLVDDANLTEISNSVTKLALASMANQFGTFELSLLEDALKDVAKGCTALFAQVKSVIQSAADSTKEPLIKSVKTVQTDLKNVVGGIKDLKLDSQSVDNKAKLVAAIAGLAISLNDFETALENSLLIKLDEQIDSSIQAAAAAAASILRATFSKTLEDLSNLKSQLDKTIAKLLRLVKLKSSLLRSDKAHEEQVAMCKKVLATVVLLEGLAQNVADDKIEADTNAQVTNAARTLVDLFKKLQNLLKTTTEDSLDQISQSLRSMTANEALAAIATGPNLRSALTRLGSEALLWLDDKTRPKQHNALEACVSLIEGTMREVLPEVKKKLESSNLEPSEIESKLAALNAMMVLFVRLRFKTCCSATQDNTEQLPVIIHAVARIVLLVKECLA